MRGSVTPRAALYFLSAPKNTWKDPRLYDETARKLALLFEQNFVKYADLANEEIRAAGPLT